MNDPDSIICLLEHAAKGASLLASQAMQAPDVPARRRNAGLFDL